MGSWKASLAVCLSVVVSSAKNDVWIFSERGGIDRELSRMADRECLKI
jgi:hypothetical protein